jgi:glycogen(starch) synthase
MTDVYVMPSVSEPFGIAPLEAIAQGVPVIISKQSGVSEVMADALKVDFWDTEALAEAICSLLYRKTLSKVLRRRSLDSLQRVTWESAATKLNQLYHDLIKQTERGIREPVLSGSPTA